MSEPIRPKSPPSLELMLAQQANDAMAQGADPHAATEMLGTMLRHLKANPDIAKQGTAALAAGADPHAVSGKVWELAQGAPIVGEPERPPLLQRTLEKLGNGVYQTIRHPIDNLIIAPAHSAATMARFSAEQQAASDLGSIGGNPESVERTVTPKEGAIAAVQTIGGAALPAVSRLARPLLLAGIGAASDPSDPIASGLASAGAGALIEHGAPAAARAAGAGGSKALTALGLRPTGRTAAEAAADAAAMRAPVGPQATNTPTADAIKNGPAQRGSVLQPSTIDRVRAASGRVVEKAGLESSKTRALREVARRFELDNVTEPDALNFADRAGSKPVAVLDLGGGNVAGLARTAKDIPSLARRQIPEFLHGRSGGSFGDEGATLQRITGDVESRLGLKPENYYQTVDEMMGQQKALSKPAYDKVRNLPVDDPEVLSLFDIPEFRFAHDAVAQAERIRPNGTSILPLSREAAAGETAALAIRDGSGRLRSDLSKVSDAALDTEWQRLAELNAKEEALHAGVQDAGYRTDYEELPSAERTGKSRRTTDQFGNRIKRQAEDLPDADGAIDGERLAADNKIVSDYNRSIVARRARQQAMDRIQAEIDRRPQPWEDDTSFDFGENVKSGAGSSQYNPQALGTLDKMRQYIGEVADGMLNDRKISRNTARAMLERLDAVTNRMDALYPDYAEARAGYAGRARSLEAYEAGKSDFLNRDPREMAAKISRLSPGEADLYRRGGYDALRSSKLTRMDDGANIGAFLEKNPDIRDRLAVLAKDPADATALRGDLNIERAMGDRKNFILGGPNTAERLIEHESTKPRVTQIGNAVRTLPGVGKFAGGLIDNTLTRRTAEQTGAVMGEVGKVMTRTGREGLKNTFDEIAALRAKDLQREALRKEIARQFAAGSVRVRQPQRER